MDDPEGVKRAFLVGAAIGAVIVAWLWVSRPDEEAPPAAAFNSSEAPGSAALPAP